MIRRALRVGSSCWLLVALAMARADAGPLTEMLKARQAKLDAVLARYPAELPASAKEELQHALGEVLDFEEMASGALGEEWNRRSEAERKEFAAAFAALLRANSIRSAEQYRVDSVEYLAETIVGAGGTVKTSVRARHTTTAIEYRFRVVQGSWWVVDYSVDGVWAVRSYRSQFARILEKVGWPGLLQRIEKRTAELQAAP
jgi:ABC-type transporter MlaC component